MPVPGFNRPGDGGGGLKLGDKLNFVNNLVAKSQPSTMADSVQTLINKVANLGYVGSKRWASGTATSYSSNGYYWINITGLAFKPSKVVITLTNPTSNSVGGWVVTLVNDGFYKIYGNPNVIGIGEYYQNGGWGNITQQSTDTYTSTFTTSGFTALVWSAAGATSYSWIAYE